MRAHKTSDGRYRVTWKQALRISNFTRVEDPETGERLQPNRKALGLLGAFGGVAASTTIMLAFLAWWFALSQEHGGVVAGLAVLFLASLYVGTAVAVSQIVTFTKHPEDQEEARQAS